MNRFRDLNGVELSKSGRDAGTGARGTAALATLLAGVVAWMRWPDPAMLLLAAVTVALAVMVWRAAAASHAAAGNAAQQSPQDPSSGAPARPAPPAAADAAPGALADAPQAPSLATPTPARPRSGLRVLVAEDHDVNRRLLAAVLDTLGHESHFAADGEAAVAAVRDQAFDVVLMDLAMPHLDGLAATRAIRALPDSRQATVPIVALTADELPQTRGRCLLAGMNDFLTKPIAADALAACLRRLYGGERGGELGGPAHQMPPSAAAGRPVLLDAGTLNDVLANLPREQVVELIERFFSDAPAQVQALRDAIRDAQMGALKVGAHGLRGAALNLGMAALAGTAAALHDGGAHLAAHEVALLLQRLEQQLRDTRVALAAMGLAAH